MAETSADGTSLYEGFKIHPRAQKWDFAHESAIRAIQEAGFASRIRRSTDFPISHYQNKSPSCDPTEKELRDFLEKMNYSNL